MSLTNYSEDDLLPLSGLQHLAFCPRQWALIHLEQQWQENQLTAEGSILHEKADAAAFSEKRDKVLIVRALPLVSYRLGLSGKTDVVEFEQTEEAANAIRLKGRRQFWRPFPVEYKRGKPKTNDIDRVQLCAQALCLEEMMNLVIDCGAIFYWQVRQREYVQFTPAIRQKVEDLAAEMHRLFSAGVTPITVRQQGCKRCSLKDICMPELGKSLQVKTYLRRAVAELNAEGGETHA